MNNQTTRDNIIIAADELFYHQGYECTSFADFSSAVKISRGNFYYHFKTKDEILSAVIMARLGNTRKMLTQWEVDSITPRDRIRSFIHILITNRDKIMRYGCPVGTLTTELAKQNHVSQHEANKVFTLFRVWLAAQFKELGFADNADDYAMHVLARSQGIAMLANAFKDKKFIKQEVRYMCGWLDERIQNINKQES